MVKRILLCVVLVVVVIQFFPAKENLSSAPPGPDALVTKYPPPPQVRALLEHACYDCHSNNTRYPWYNKIQPVGWWLASHVNDGKRALNFSAIGGYTLQRQAHKLNAVSDQVTDHEMPLWSYRLIHGDARLSDQQIQLLADWADDLHDQIVAREPVGTAPVTTRKR